MVEFVHAHLVRASPVSACRGDALMQVDAVVCRIAGLGGSVFLRVSLLVAFLALASVSAANADTLLMWDGFVTPSVANLVVGVCEGLLLWALVRRIHGGAAVGLLVLANYVSAIVGYLLFRLLVPAPFHPERALLVFGLMVAVSYLITAVCEFPFVLLAVGRVKSRFRKAVGITLIIQAASYVALFGWAIVRGDLSLMTSTERVPLSEMSSVPGVAVYYLSSDDDGVYRLDLAAATAGEAPTTDPPVRRVGRYNVTDFPVRLVAIQETSATERLHLVVGEYWTKSTTVTESFARQAIPLALESEGWSATGFNYGVNSIVSGEPEWRFHKDWTCLSATKTGEKGRTHELRWQTPFSSVSVTCGVALPSDKVLFEIRPDWVRDREMEPRLMLYDPATRRLAEVARGYGAVAAIEEPSGD